MRSLRMLVFVCAIRFTRWVVCPCMEKGPGEQIFSGAFLIWVMWKRVKRVPADGAQLFFCLCAETGICCRFGRCCTRRWLFFCLCAETGIQRIDLLRGAEPFGRAGRAQGDDGGGRPQGDAFLHARM